MSTDAVPSTSLALGQLYLLISFSSCVDSISLYRTVSCANHDGGRVLLLARGQGKSPTNIRSFLRRARFCGGQLSRQQASGLGGKADFILLFFLPSGKHTLRRMKFGEYLREQKVGEWQHFYLDYDKLKAMIKDLEAIHIAAPIDTSGTGV